MFKFRSDSHGFIEELEGGREVESACCISMGGCSLKDSLSVLQECMYIYI